MLAKPTPYTAAAFQSANPAQRAPPKATTMLIARAVLHICMVLAYLLSYVNANEERYGR